MFLTITFFSDIVIAPFAKFAVTITGNISGASPTATDKANVNASTQLCLTIPLIRKTSGAMIIIKRNSSIVTPFTPLSKLVRGLRPLTVLANDAR